MKPAVVLLSGGLDSATVLAMAAADGYACYALSFDYGQRHRRELQSAAKLAKHPAVRRHVILKLDLQQFGGSALTGDIQVPKDRAPEAISRDIPVTYVPARNTIFLSCALGWAEVLDADDIYLGVNALDYSGYPDCRPEFIAAFEKLAALATKAGVADHRTIKLRTPLIEMRKANIIRAGLQLGVDYASTFSCYDPPDDAHSCGRCDACKLRLEAFAQVGVADPIAYAPVGVDGA